MAPVVVVFFVWFAVVLVAGAVAIAYAERVHAPAWGRRLSTKMSDLADMSAGAIGRIGTGAIVVLAGWSMVIIAGWLLGEAAHKLEPTIDKPSFNWWQDHYLTGSWHGAWWKLTDIGSPPVTQIMTLAGAALLAVLYFGRHQWWLPSLVLLVSYPAEKYSQTILKLVVDRGHPPTTMGTWPSGGMGRLIDVYGLIIYFVLMRYWRGSRRMWALGLTLLALCASVQAYARINNLEHWMTDVIGGFVYGVLLLILFVLVHRAMSSPQPVKRSGPATDPAGGESKVRTPEHV